MRAGWAVIIIGALGALIGRNPDVYILGVLCLIGGLLLLRVKGV